MGDVGIEKGQYYALNVPLKEGMDDESYKFVFEPIINKVLQVYQPNAIVICAGADSLAGDRIGCFNLSLEGHSNCIEFLARYNVPLLVLGGPSRHFGFILIRKCRRWLYNAKRVALLDVRNGKADGNGLTGRVRLKDLNFEIEAFLGCQIQHWFITISIWIQGDFESKLATCEMQTPENSWKVSKRNAFKTSASKFFRFCRRIVVSEFLQRLEHRLKRHLHYTYLLKTSK